MHKSFIAAMLLKHIISHCYSPWNKPLVRITEWQLLKHRFICIKCFYEHMEVTQYGMPCPKKFVMLNKPDTAVWVRFSKPGVLNTVRKCSIGQSCPCSLSIFLLLLLLLLQKSLQIMKYDMKLDTAKDNHTGNQLQPDLPKWFPLARFCFSFSLVSLFFSF